MAYYTNNLLMEMCAEVNNWWGNPVPTHSQGEGFSWVDIKNGYKTIEFDPIGVDPAFTELAAQIQAYVDGGGDNWRTVYATDLARFKPVVKKATRKAAQL